MDINTRDQYSKRKICGNSESRKSWSKSHSSTWKTVLPAFSTSIYPSSKMSVAMSHDREHGTAVHSIVDIPDSAAGIKSPKSGRISEITPKFEGYRSDNGNITSYPWPCDGKTEKQLSAIQTDVHKDGAVASAEDRNSPMLCHCEYPQPPDADLITVDTTHADEAGCSADNTARPKKTQSNRRPSRRKSLWKRSKKMATDCVVYVTWHVCYCLGFLWIVSLGSHLQTYCDHNLVRLLYK